MQPSDYVSILQLLARYCHVVDGQRWDDLGLVFAPDGSMTVIGLYAPTTGRDDLRRLYSEVMRHPLAHHSTSVMVIDEGNDEVHVQSKWVTVRKDGSTGSGVYDDILIRAGDGWRIRTRTAIPASAESR